MRNPENYKKNQGFTLLEVMVVIAMMAILTAFVVPYLPGDRAELMQTEMDRFQSKIVYAQTQAILQSQDLGLIVDDASYKFVQRVNSGWEEFEEEPLQSQEIESVFKQKVLIEDVEFFPEISDDPELIKPVILFYSSGEMSPFEYQLALSEQQYLSLKFDPLGESEQESFNEE